MRFATVIVIVTIANLRVVSMNHHNETPKEIIVIEATVWVILLLFFGVSYLLV